MLEGLEVSVISLSEVRDENRVFRYDSQYFGKTALAAEARIKSGKWERIVKLADEVESFGAYALTNQFAYVDEGIPFLRCVNIRNGFADFGDVLFIDRKANNLLTKSEVKPNMVLLTMSGSVGNATVALESWNYPINSNQDIAKITPKNGVSPFYLAAFIGSRYGQIQMERLPVGSIQQHIFIWMIEQVAIARFSQEFEQAVSNAIRSAYETQAICRNYQKHAEHTLLRALTLENWQPSEPLSYSRRASEAFAAERLDSDYFAPRVSELLKKLSESGLTIGAVAPVRHERFSPGKEGEFDYIEIGNVRADGTADADHLPQSEAPSRASQIARAGDVLTSSVRPIRRLSALVTPEQDGYVCSSGFVVLQPRDVPSEVLLTYLRLPVVCELMDLHTSASLYPAISETDLLSLPYHPIAKDAEAEIVLAVQSAHAARRKAHTLLESAKHAVEIAIEQSEAAALEYLRKQGV